MITLYHSDGCPKCMILERALKEKGIEYESVTDIDVMLKKGFMSVPVLGVGEDTLAFPQALEYVKNYKG